MSGKDIVAIILVLAAGVTGYAVWKNSHVPQEAPISTASFTCDAGKTISASFYIDHASVVLSDGRKMTLPQVVSADGANYSNTDQTFMLWTRGNTAYVTEGTSSEETFANCITTSVEPGEESWNTFASSTAGFSIRYPSDYAIDETYSYEGFGPGKTIPGIKFVVPDSLTSGTNLSGFDTGVSVEQLPSVANCTASAFLNDKVVPAVFNDNGTTYSFASSSDAGAGNFYEDDVYAIPGTSPCVAVRYMIHSTNIGNYTPGDVQEFDRPALLAIFDKIRQSLVLGK